MPQLRNVKHEAFARYLAQGMPQLQAHAQAGFKSNSGNAATLANRDDIQERVSELKEIIRNQRSLDAAETDEALQDVANYEEMGINKNWVMARLMANVEDAREAGQIAAANKALEMIGKEIGMFNGTPPDGGDDKGEKSDLPSKMLDNFSRALEQARNQNDEKGPIEIQKTGDTNAS